MFLIATLVELGNFPKIISFFMSKFMGKCIKIIDSLSQYILKADLKIYFNLKKLS